MADRSLDTVSLPLEVRARLAELELELSEGKQTCPSALSDQRKMGGLGCGLLQGLHCH